MHSLLQAEPTSESIRIDTASDQSTVAELSSLSVNEIVATVPRSKLLSVLSSHFAKVAKEEALLRSKRA